MSEEPFPSRNALAILLGINEERVMSAIRMFWFALVGSSAVLVTTGSLPTSGGDVAKPPTRLPVKLAPVRWLPATVRQPQPGWPIVRQPSTIYQAWVPTQAMLTENPNAQPQILTAGVPFPLEVADGYRPVPGTYTTYAQAAAAATPLGYRPQGGRFVPSP